MNKRTLRWPSAALKYKNYCLAFAGLASIAAAACATPRSDGKPQPQKLGVARGALTSAEGIAKAQKAMDFLVPGAVQFTQESQCLSCHRQPDVLIATSMGAQLLPGVTLNSSAADGTGYIANLVLNNQQGDGRWDFGGAPKSMSAISLWAIAGYARAGGSVNVLPSIRNGLLWLVPLASQMTFPQDGGPFAGQTRNYILNDWFEEAPQMFDWYLPTTESVFATRVLLDMDTSLSAANVSMLSAQQVSFTDALEGRTMRDISTTSVQHLALTALAMAESGRTTSANAQAIGAQLLARQTAGSGWADPASPDGQLHSVNALTSGEALYALCRLGVRPRGNAAGAGLDWLAAQQSVDGHWDLPGHDSAVATSWALLAIACVSNPRGSAQFEPLTGDGAPAAPVSESFASTLSVTNTASDPRTATVSISGAPPGAVVKVTPASLELSGDASGTFSISIELPPGLPASTSYPFTATVSFADGGGASTQTSAIYTLAVGSTPSAVYSGTSTSFIGAQDHGAIGSTMQLAAKVEDYGHSPVQEGTIVFDIDGFSIGSATYDAASGTFARSWTIPDLSIGHHVLHAAYQGKSGSVVLNPSTATRDFDVAPAPPPPPASVGVPDGASSSDGGFTLHGTGTPGDTISVVANGVLVGSATIDSEGKWTAPIALSPGAYKLEVVESNATGPSAPASVNVSVQPTAPIITGPEPGTTSSDMVTEIKGTATPGATITVRNASGVLATTTAGDDGKYSVSVSLPPGPNSLDISQTVNGQTSALTNVHYNQAPAAPSITYPVPQASTQTTKDITLRGTTVPDATVTALSGGTVLATATASQDGTYALPVVLESGHNMITVKSAVGGVVSAASRQIDVRFDGKAPSFLITARDIEAYGPAKGAIVSWQPFMADDAQDGQLPTTCDHTSGSMFPIGTTPVTCAAQDSAGNVTSIMFNVIVHLQSFATVKVPTDLVAFSKSLQGAKVDFEASATDKDGNAIEVACSPASGSTFPLGQTPVTCTATDDVSHTSTSSTFKVTVQEMPYDRGSAVTGGGGASSSSGSSYGSSSSGCSMGKSTSGTDLLPLGGVLGVALALSRRRRQNGRTGK